MDTRAAAMPTGAYAKKIEDLVLDAYKAHPSMTPDEAAAKIGKSILTVRPTCTKLVQEGKLVKTDLTAKNAVSGKRAKVLRLAA